MKLRILHLVDSISECGGRAGAFLVALAMSVVLYETMMRYVFNRPTIWAQELCLHIFVVGIMFGGAYNLLHEAHVRMDVLYSRFSPRGRAIMDIATFIFFGIFVGVLLFRGADLAWQSIEAMERTMTTWAPVLWPVKLGIAIGAFLLLLQGLANLTRHVTTALGSKKLEH